MQKSREKFFIQEKCSLKKNPLIFVFKKAELYVKIVNMKDSKSSVVRYGNVTLSQIVQFMVTICGKDALIQRGVLTESELNDAYKEKGSFFKYKYTDDNSIFGKIRNFFSELADEFEIKKMKIHQKTSLDGEKWGDTAQDPNQIFYTGVLWEFMVQIGGTRTFENTQKNHATNLVFRRIITACIDPNFQNFLRFLISSSNFDSVFTEFAGTRNFENIYGEIAAELEENTGDNFQHVKRSIERCRKNNIAPTWEVLYALLKSTKKTNKEYCLIFLSYYFYKNFRDSLEIVSISKSDWSDLEQFCSTHNILQDFLDDIPLEKSEKDKFVEFFLKGEMPHEFEDFVLAWTEFDFVNSHVNDTMIQTILKYGAYFDRLIAENSKENLNRFMADYQHLRLKIPHSIVFWEQWFKAKDFVFRFLDTGDVEQLKSAVGAYRDALERGRYFAGKSLEPFIQEAIAVSAYYDYKSDLKTARNRLAKSSDPMSDTKTPLSANTKPFYDFALCFDLVLRDMSDASNLYYHAEQNFWKFFRLESQTAKEMHGKDMIDSIGLIDKEKYDEALKRLEKVTDKKINTLIDDGRPVEYTPISFAIWNKKFDLVEDFLDRGNFPSLDLNVPNTNNTFPITEILTQYKKFRDEKSKSLIFRILERTDRKTLFTESNRQKISVLEEAINTFDSDVVSAIVNKMTDGGKVKFRDDFRINADELSPLYWAINQRMYLVLPKKRIVSDFRNGIGDITHKNLFVPGFTEGQKDSQRLFPNDPDFTKFMEKESDNIKEEFTEKIIDVFSSNREEKLAQSDKILDLLISCTEDIDWIKYRKDVPEQGCTALTYAVELDDVTVCRKLIAAGADVNISVGIAHIGYMPFCDFGIPNNAIYRAINYKSWEVLEMLLTEQREKMRQEMHCGATQMTPLVYFLLSLLSNPEEISKHIPLVEKFVPLLLDCGASLGEPTELGSAKDMLSEFGLMNCAHGF